MKRALLGTLVAVTAAMGGGWLAAPALAANGQCCVQHLHFAAGPYYVAVYEPNKRIVNIALLANNNTQRGNVVEIDTTVEGRNTTYQYPNECGNPSVATALSSHQIPASPTPDPAES